MGMRSGTGFRIARVRGIPIILDVTFLISFALITVILGTNILPDMIEPDPSATTTWTLAVVAGVIFFLSLLLHELAHSLLAMGYGMQVSSITLFLLGGVSQIKQEADRASQEFLIAIVGPLTSAILGAGFLGVFFLATGQDSAIAAVVGWLGIVNLALAAFNMLPGFPLDGGRVFRSVIWGLTGSRTRATRWAARVGQGFGGLLAGVGVLLVLRINIGLESGGLGGIWMILIGGFLFNAAAQSLRAVQVEEGLAKVRVRDMMNTQFRTIEAVTRLHWLAPARDRIDPTATFLVTDHDTVVGVVTGLAMMMLDEQRYATATAREVMIRADAVAPIAPSASGSEALNRLQQERTIILPVVEDGRILGLVGLDQVAQVLGKQQPQRRSV